MNEQIGNKINDKTYIKLTPFKGFVLENFPFIEADFDAITNYQLLCKIIEYLNNVITNQNTVQELGTDLVNAYNSLVDAVNLAINEFETDVTADINQFKVDINNDFDEFTSDITTQFNNLKNYVDNYFDNNFPELVSDKLDEMAEDGTLENLLNDTAHLIKVYNTYTEMIADSSSFTNGLRLKTLGYYSINDGGGADYYVNNSVIATNYQIELENDLYLNLILKNNTLNIKQFGAYGDNTHDDTNAFINAINSLSTLNKDIIFIPIGNYVISNTIILKNKNKLIGESKYNTKLIQKTNECLNKPLITSDTTDDLQLSDIKLKNLSIIVNGIRTVYPIIIYNCTNTELDNVYIEGTNLSTNNGVWITKTANFTGDNFVSKIHDCRFSKATLKLNSTDSYIERNELWGNTQECALQIQISTNTIIENNEIVGGSTYGGIYFDSEGEKSNIQILGNYFDGSYDDIDTKYGIYSLSTLNNCLIANNRFWRQKSGAIKLLNSHGSIISNNNFIENDYYNNGESEIYIGTDPNSIYSYGNNICNNSFYRFHCLDTDKTTVITRPTTNQPPILIINQQSGGYPFDIIANNNVYWSTYYSELQRNNVALKSYNNNSNLLSYSAVDVGISSNSLGFKELVYVNQNNTNNLYLQLYSKNPTRGDFEIANNKVFLITTYFNSNTHYDANNVIPNTFKIFLNNPTIVDNIPSEAQVHACMFENFYVTAGYQFQRLTSRDKIYSRFQENGSWTSWTSCSLT